MYIDDSLLFGLLHYYIHTPMFRFGIMEVLTEGLSLLFGVPFSIVIFSIVIFIIWTFSANKHMDGWMDGWMDGIST